MKRYLATFFRGKWLYLATLVVMLVATGAGTYYLSRSKYEASALIWVDKPALSDVLDPNAANTGYGYVTPPANLEADKLYQLAQTDSFLTAVVKGSAAAGELTGEPAHDNAVLAATRKSLAIGVIGTNTVRIGYTGKDPVLCQQIVQGVIDQFQNWNLQVEVEQSSAELKYYQQQLQLYQGQIDDVTKQINQLQSQAKSLDPQSPEYLNLQRLQRELESSRSLYTATQVKIDQSKYTDSQGGQYQFQVLDKPTVPQLPSTSMKKLLMYIGIGIGASFGLVLTAVIVATWQDRAVRTTDDLARLTDIPTLAVLPPLRGGRRDRRGPRLLGRGAARSAGRAAAAGASASVAPFDAGDRDGTKRRRHLPGATGD